MYFPLMTFELIKNFNIFMLSSQLLYVTLLKALLLNMLSNSLVQILTPLIMDTFKSGSVNVLAEWLADDDDVLFCCGLVVEFILILWNMELVNMHLLNVRTAYSK
jgi:hypothetical protein